MIRKAGVLILFLLAVTLCAALNVGSVTSRDTGDGTNRVVIGISGDATYSVQPSAGGSVHRVVIPNTDGSAPKADYRRLSPVIDRISTYVEGTNTVVEIRTMRPASISHSKSTGQIVLELDTGATSPSPSAVKPKGKELPPVYVRPAKPKLEEPKVEEPAVVDSIAETRFPSSVAAPVLPPPVMEEEESAIAEFVRHNPLYLGLLAVLSILLIIIVRAMRKHRTTPEPAELSGVTLVLDEDTKKRMVMKLIDQGWTPRETAMELKLHQREVDAIIAQARREESGEPS